MRNRNGLPTWLPNWVSYRWPNGDDFFHETDSEYKGINKPPNEELAELEKKNVELVGEALFRKEWSQKKAVVNDAVTTDAFSTIKG